MKGKQRLSKGDAIIEEERSNVNLNGKKEDGIFEVRKVNWWDKIFLSRAVRATIGITFFGLLLPLLIYIFMYITSFTLSDRSCAIYENFRVECMAGRFPSATQCRDTGCCWNQTHEPHCYHSLPSYHNYRSEVDSDPNKPPAPGKDIVLHPLVNTSPVETEMHPINVRITPITEEHLSVLLYDKKRFSGPPPTSGLKLTQTNFNVRTYGLSDGKPPFSFAILDRKNDSVMLETAEGPLIASDRYWVISLKFPNSNIYGWGGAGVEGPGAPTLRLSRGPLSQWAGGGRRLAHPFLLSLNQTGRAFGVLISAEGPLEVDLLESGLLTLRAVTTVSLEIHVLSGPSPSDVTRQVADVVGYPNLPPYWALGLHVCRNDSEASQNFLEAALAEGLPFDSDCLGLHALGDYSFDVNVDQIEAIQNSWDILQREGKKYLPVQYAQISIENYPAHTDGVDKGVFVQYGNGIAGPFVGTYDGRGAVYPSLIKPGTAEWLKTLLSNIEESLNISLAGIVIEDDSPLSTGLQGTNPFPDDSLKFIPRGLNNSISQGTLWWMSQHSDSVLHYQIHNSYGYLFGRLLADQFGTTANATQGGKRRLVLGEWTHPGTGTFGGHGGAVRVKRTWTAMRSAFVSALANGLVGIPLSAGIAACGRPVEDRDTELDEKSRIKLSDQFDSSLCRRWVKLGSLLPLWRVHLPSGNITDGMMSSLLSAAKMRYSLLPYLYTQMFHASNRGTPVARHLLFEYPDVELARDADDQVLLGPALMVAPSFLPDSPTVSIFFPKGRWYAHPGGREIEHTGRIVSYLLKRDKTPIFMRAGYIIPTQEPGPTAPSSRSNPLGLLVALKCNLNETCAEGDLFLDDGESLGTVARGEYDLLKFTAPTERSVVVQRVKSWLTCGGVSSAISTKLDSVTLYGASENLSGVVTVNGLQVPNATAKYVDKDNHVVKVMGIGADWCGLATGAIMTIEWI